LSDRTRSTSSKRAASRPSPAKSGAPRRDAGWREVKPAENKKDAAAEGRERKRRRTRPRKAKKVEKSASKASKDGKEKKRVWGRRVSPRVVILVIVFAACAAFAFSPLMRDIDAVSKRKKVEAKLKDEKTTTEKLQRKLKDAASKLYVEQEARKQRLVAPGETLYLVTTDGDTHVSYRVKNLQSMEEAWERIRVMTNSAGTRQEQSAPTP
jgi:hypothetical protein